MGGTECFIDVEIVKAKIPLLLSKHSLKNAQAAIDIANDKVSVFDKNVDLFFSTSGHYCLNIFPRESRNMKKFYFSKMTQVLLKKIIRFLKYISSLGMRLVYY